MSKEPEIKNAIIKSVIIENERGMLTASVCVEHDGGVQCFGGYQLLCLDASDEPNWAGLFFFRVMEVCGVWTWDALKGKAIRIRVEDGLIRAIAHIVKDEWFDPKCFENPLSMSLANWIENLTWLSFG